MRRADPSKYVKMETPCSRGHFGLRYKRGACLECSKSRSLHRQADPKEREKRLSRMRDYNARHPWNMLLIGARGRAKERGWEFKLGADWAKKHWNGKCELTGIPFDTSKKNGVANPFSPSVDRIDPTVGYLPDNCRFILHAINMFKGAASDDEILLIARAMVAQMEPA